MKVYGGMALIGVAAVGISETDKSMNYIETEAVVTAAEVDCFVKSSKGKIVEKKSDKMAYMDCKIAPLAAVQFGYSEKDVQQRVKFEYRFTSPVDGKTYTDKHEDEYNADRYQKGKKFKLFAHKEEPSKNRIN